jgi:hypothetical protein
MILWVVRPVRSSMARWQIDTLGCPLPAAKTGDATSTIPAASANAHAPVTTFRIIPLLLSGAGDVGDVVLQAPS